MIKFSFLPGEVFSDISDYLIVGKDLYNKLITVYVVLDVLYCEALAVS